MPGGCKSRGIQRCCKCSTNLKLRPCGYAYRLSEAWYFHRSVRADLNQSAQRCFARTAGASPGPGRTACDRSGLHQHYDYRTSAHDFRRSSGTPDFRRSKDKSAGCWCKGIQLVGCTCVGQDLQLRGAHYTEIFDGHAGNNYTSEAILATGAIDAVLSEFNCTLPGIEPICEELKIRQICLDDVAKKANAELMPFEFENREEQSSIIIDKSSNPTRNDGEVLRYTSWKNMEMTIH